ncbi:MAG: tol-pal system YbgF family protein [Elusimicrobiota bacterium]
MKRIYFLIVAVSAVWWYATRRFNFSDAMVYAHKNPAASWAPAVEYSVGLVYYQRGDYPKAEDTFKQLLTDFPTGQYEARGLLRLSEAAEENGDYPTAKEMVQRYIDEFPDGPDRSIADRRKELFYNK